MPCIDFQLMRERAGVLDGDILEVVAAMEPAAKKRALDAIWDVEQQVCPAPPHPRQGGGGAGGDNVANSVRIHHSTVCWTSGN